MRPRVICVGLLMLAAACSQLAGTPDLVWDAEGDVVVHLGVSNRSDGEATANLDIRLEEQAVVRGAFVGDPGNTHPPVHRYEFRVASGADHLTVLHGGRVVAVADLGDAPEVWVDVAYHDSARIDVTVYDEPVQYG